MKKNRPLSPGAERLRQAIKDIYSPIDWSAQGIESPAPFDNNHLFVEPKADNHFTARGLARELNIPICRVLKCVSQNIVRPTAKLGNSWCFVASDLEKLRSHLTK